MSTKFVVALLLTIAAASSLRAQNPNLGPDWSITAGALVVITPTHAGSDENLLLPIPLVQVSYRDRFFAGPSDGGLGGGIGAYLVRTKSVRVSAELGMMQNRPADRADVLAGTTDKDWLATVGASVSYQVGPLAAAIGAVQGINDDGGAMASAQLAYTQMIRDRVIVTLGSNVVVANTRQFRRDFGVTESEAAARAALIAAGDKRLRTDEGMVYQPAGGLSQVGSSLSVIYLFSQHWAATAFQSFNRLSGRAAESPLAREREQWSGGLGIVWRR